MDWLIPKAAYIHVPFCAHQCGYCDFAVSTDETLKEVYLDALSMEMRDWHADLETIFIGGGTPTSLSEPQLKRLLALTPSAVEFSIESTPDSITPEKIELLADHGVTRVSVGVQSFDSATLTALDRQHGVAQIHTAIAAVRAGGLGVSLDLIFGAPNQTLAAWANDLRTAIDLGVDHISTYGLTYETGTPLWKRRRRGDVTPQSEDDELAMYETAIATLTAAGYEHYEVSNFAKPGHRCRHNEHYWANHAYFGFGVGAARYIDGERAHNVRDTNLYIRRVLSGEDPTQQRERLEPRERALETIAVQLRRHMGVDRNAFQTQTGFTLDSLVGGAVTELVNLGLLVNDTSVRLTHRGRCLADAVIEKVFQFEA